MLNILILSGIEYGYIPPDIEMPMYLAFIGHKVLTIFHSKSCGKIYVSTNENGEIVVLPYLKITDVFKLVNYLSQLLRKRSFDIIFASRSSLYVFLSILFLKLKNIPIIFIMENPVEQVGVSRRLKASNKIIGDFVYILRRHFLLLLLRNMDLIIAISNGIKEDLIQHKISRNIVVIPEGVEVSRFKGVSGDSIRNKYSLDASKLILYVGTLDKLRNLGVLIRAFSRVLLKRKNVKLMLIGEGDDANFLKSLTNKLEISSDVIFTGWVNPRDVPEYINASDICISIIPPFSFYKASCPIKIHEYMAAGKPVIANEEISEQRKVISESKGGILTTYDYEAVAQTIIKLIDAPQEALKMGENGRKWVINNRSYDILVRRIERICFELLARRK